METSYSPVPASTYFEARDLTIGPEEIVSISCGRNELDRIPYFLEYYRGLGVTRFLFVDNDSTDGTAEYLADQPDVEYFWTDTSYRGSSAGRLWMQELADTYARDRWVLTLDVDELLVYPGSEVAPLRALCDYMDEQGQLGLFTIMLDMYSDRPLSKTVYERGTDFVETCRYFETDSYWLKSAANPPFLSVFGGPRNQLFNAANGTSGRPMMKKIPLVKWVEDFSYIFSTHSHRYIPLSDVTGTLLHFKFFASFSQVAAADALRGDRRQQQHYDTYSTTLADDPCFYSRRSIRYDAPVDLVRLGVMSAPGSWRKFVADLPTEDGEPIRVDAVMPDPVAAEGKFTIRSMASVWPFVHNRAVAGYFAAVEPTPAARVAALRTRANGIRLIDVHGDHVLLKIDEGALHRWQRSGFELSVRIGDQVVASVGPDDRERFQVLTGALDAGLYRLDADIRAAVPDPGTLGLSVVVALYLTEVPEAHLTASPVDDQLVGESRWFPAGGVASRRAGLLGALDQLIEGKVTGWVYDVELDSFKAPIAVYANGRFVRLVWPSWLRPSLDQVVAPDSLTPGMGFTAEVPLGFFSARGEEVELEFRIAGTNLTLQRSPMLVPPGVTDLRWVVDAGEWAQPEPVHGPLE